MHCKATGKVRHHSKDAACIAAKRVNNCRLNVFKCAKCKGWHLGNSNHPFRVQERFDQILARYKTDAEL